MGYLGRRGWLGTAAALGLAAPALAAYPERPVRILCPWPPGGVADILCRALAQALAAPLGQPVVVENRAGANGGVGAEAAARAPADGYTVFCANADTHAINPTAYRRLPYDPATDFVPISLFSRLPFALALGPSLRGVADFAGFVAAARARPGAVTYASWGVGSASHLTMERVARASGGLELLHVPFTGQAPGITAVISGQVDAMFLPAGGAEASARDGRARVVAVSAERRIAILPAVPTLAELGVEVVGGNWFALCGPTRMPREAVVRLAAATAEAVRAPALGEVFAAQATVPEATTPEAMGRFVAEERERWGAVIRAAGVVLE